MQFDFLSFKNRDELSEMDPEFLREKTFDPGTFAGNES